MTRKRRSLTDEEQSLWDQIAQNIKPLKQEKKQTLQNSSKAKSSSFRLKEPALPLSPTLPSAPSSRSLSSTRRIRRVRNAQVEARLDLHGLTRSQAQVRLTQFLHSCQNLGYLWVLVITGKGRRNANAEASYETHSPKTLRELVPQWLEDPSLHPIVSAYAIAKPCDGGGGALYVRLKRLP